MALFKKKQKEKKEFSVLPRHIGIIMDGNGRWAKKRGLPRTAGHRAGADVFEKICKECGRLGIEEVTFYAFSTENWKRPKEEVDTLMRLFHDFLIEAKERLTESGDIRIKFVGEREGIDSKLLSLMDEAEFETAERKGTLVNLAINYGGRQEIVSAVNKLIAEGKTEITEKDISSNVYTMPDLSDRAVKKGFPISCSGRLHTVNSGTVMFFGLILMKRICTKPCMNLSIVTADSADD